MENTEVKKLDIAVVRMCGLVLIPMLWMTIRGLYYSINSIFQNSGSDLYPISTEYYFQVAHFLLWGWFVVYLLLFGKAAARLLRLLMDKWPLESRYDAVGYVIRIWGIKLSCLFILDVVIVGISFLFTPIIESNQTIYGILSIAINIFVMIYLLFFGRGIFSLIYRREGDKADYCRVAVGILGLYYLSAVVVYLYNTLFTSIVIPEYFSLYWQNMTFKTAFEVGYSVVLCLYLLLGGNWAVRLLGSFMAKWPEDVRELPTAYFIRTMGLMVLIGQVKSLVLLIQKIISEGRISEFTRLYNLQNVLNLSCLNELVAIIFFVAVAWYLLYHGRTLQKFIDR